MTLLSSGLGRWLCAAVWLVATGCATAVQAAEKRVALVIGNGDYINVPRLDNPPRDADLIAGTLKQLGFTLVGDGALDNLDKPGMERAIRDFGRAIGPGTVALFYYSGHGLQVRGGNYLVPIQANLATASDVDFELVDVDVVVRQMDAAHSSLNLIILDACRNNPFGGRGLRDGTGGLAEMRAPPATLISYATQPGGVAQDGAPGGDSPYTVALSDSLRTRGVDVFKAFNMVGVKVARATNGAQTPWVAASPIDGEFVLAPGTPDAAPAASTAGPPAFIPADRDALYWQSVQSSSKPEELEAYLKRYPDGAFADLARMRLALLQPGRPLPQPEAPTAAPSAPSPPEAGPVAPAIVQAPAPKPAEPKAARRERPPLPAEPVRPKTVNLPVPTRPVPQAAPVAVVGFSATAANATGRRFQSNGAGSETAAVSEALRQCHGSSDGGSCRIVGMAHAGG